MSPAGGGQQGHSDAPRGAITAAPSGPSRPGGARPAGGTGPDGTGAARFSSRRLLRARSGSGSPGCPAPGGAGRARSSPALRRAAQLEGKILGRRKQTDPRTVGQQPPDEESRSSAAGPERSAEGRRNLKSSAATGANGSLGKAASKEEENFQSPKKDIMAKQHLHLDSEEDMRESTESSLEFSSSKDNRRVAVSDSKWARKKSKTPVPSGTPPPSHKEVSLAEVSETSLVHSKDSEKSAFGRVNSPPAGGNLSVQRKMSSESPPTSMKDNSVKVTLPATRNTKQSQVSLQSERSEIKSLDELFSKAADGEDSISSSSYDFRLNILSLDDLAPNITSEAAELKQKETDIQIAQESKRNSKKDSFLVVKDQVSLQMRSAAPGASDASERDADRTETEAEISEHLSGVSADFPGHKQDDLDDDERTINSEYSDDFERSQCTADGEGASRASGQRSQSRRCCGEHASPPAPPPPPEQVQVRRVTVREAAVQTLDLPFAYCWANTTPAALLDPPVGNSYVDPVPIARHVISADAVEALTAYSPAALVLNTMLKQHLMLTQQFVENIHHLHLAVVESLEKEKFHYHTLEEAKEYIKTHKSPPATTEKAREGIQKAREEKMD